MKTLKRTGKVDKIVWSGDNGYKIIAVTFVGGYESEKIVGYMNVIEGQTYTFSGEEIDHAKYGKQFKVTSYEMNDVKTGDEIIDFLSSNHFKGIGMRTASKIYNHLGDDTMDVLKSEPERLEEIDISPEIINEIKSKMVGLDGIDELFKMLKPLDFSEYLITDIYQYLNLKGIKDLVKYLKYNSYLLIDDVKLMTFEKADKIFLMYNEDGINSNERLRAAFMYFSKDLCYRSGDTLVRKADLFDTLRRRINLDYETFEQIVEELFRSGDIEDIDSEFIMAADFYNNEDGIARNIRLRQNFVNKGLDEKRVRAHIVKLEEEFKINYSDVQKEAIVNALSNNFSIITGGPGTGKTTIIKAIVTIFEQLKYPNEKVELLLNKIMLCAPTGRAAQRMKEATGYNAKTIHSLLEWDPHLNKFNRGIDDPLAQELVIIDEFSMVDIFLANSLFKAIRPDAIVLVVGDSAQLESVAPGNVLGDFVFSDAISTVKLDLIFRQGDGSKIAELAKSIDTNEDIELVNTHDMSIINRTNNLKDLVKLVVDKSYDAGYDELETQVLYPKYAGAAGIDALNEVLKPEITKDCFKTDERVYQIGDKVMQLKNNYDKSIYNGDIGFVTKIINKGAKANQNAIIVKFKNTEVELTRNDLYDLTHAYAISIHKSQGSEFKVVVMPIDSGSDHMLTKKLIYTAITRAKDKLIIIGDMNYFYKGIEQADIPRHTYLQKLLTTGTETPKQEKKLEQFSQEENAEISPFDFL
ncbi:ATP-dependent RecD-like DNA helicase [Mollicutes bacterium LVI A0078]|nr:ATP-dependent RecD-like DNA helicase [Mollicutes bacterium LVI A0075]WOO90844.1 ATP-dependent RecD-like DNA helicase [Mollicutes bacterium LVI A0078]